MNEIILQTIPLYLKKIFSLEDKNIIEHEGIYVNHDEEIDIPLSEITDPVMFGIDQYDRPYICLKLYHSKTNTEEAHILYQKMSNIKFPWFVNETTHFFGDYIINKDGKLISDFIKHKLESISGDNRESLNVYLSNSTPPKK